MSLKKTNGSKKDPLKTPKVWQKARREKMKIYFDELQAVLPFYDPSAPMSRFEILEKSKSYIKDLQEQNQDLLNGGFDEVYKIKMMKLKQRVKELLKRVDQLTDLLRTANIMIPPIEAYPEGLKTSTFKWMSQRPKKWTEKINLIVPDDKIKSVLTLIKDYKKNSGNHNLKKKSNESSAADTVAGKKKKLLRKINKAPSKKTAKLNNSNNSSNQQKNESFNESQSPSQFKENQPVDFNSLSSSTPNISKSNDSLNLIPVESSKVMTTVTVCQPTPSCNPCTSLNKPILPQTIVEKPSNVILPTAPNLLQSNTFLLTNDGSLVQLPLINSPGTVINSNSNLLTSIVKPNTGLVTPLLINKPSPVILLQKPPQIIQTAQIISSAPQIVNVSQPGIQIFGGSIVCTSTSPTVVGAKTLPHILSKAPANKKRIARDSTVTTYVNKIPIPALSKHSYSKKVVTVNTANSKEKSTNTKLKDVLEKATESEAEKENSQEMQIRKENSQTQDQEISTEVSEKEKEDISNEEMIPQKSQKRTSGEEKVATRKKQKVNESTLTNLQNNVFKPIENEGDGLFCNLGLPSSINPSLSVSPTAAFLSSFPIVAPARSEADDDIPEKREDEDKEVKNKKEIQVSGVEKDGEEKEKNSLDKSKQLLTEEPKTSQIPENSLKEKVQEKPKKLVKADSTSHITTSATESIISVPAAVNNNNNAAEQLQNCKSWTQFTQENCEIRADSFYIHTDNNLQINNSSGNPVEVTAPPDISFSGLTTMNISTFNNYSQNSLIKADHLNLQNTIGDQQVPMKNNQFECSQKENYMNKMPSYNNAKKVFQGAESYSVNKSQSNNYQMDSGPDYQLVPAKEIPNQRNARTVNWMTEPDVRNRALVYGSQNQNDKMAVGKLPTYAEADHFYMPNQNSKIQSDCSGSFVINDQNKINYQKNEYYMKDQRCKAVEKRSDSKCYNKTQQNMYNIFDYNYSGSYYEEDANKYCNLQTYPGKNKKNISQSKKKGEDIIQINNDQQVNTSTKRLQDQIITNLDFNPTTGQDCFTWVPGKNVEWLPSKSFGLESNLVVPSTLPTLVGDLALGTTPSNENIQNKIPNSKMCSSSLKPSDISLELGMSGNAAAPKSMETMDSSKQYLEPFTNLSKNIFDVTPPNINNHIPKNQFDKFSFPVNSNTNSETIVIKNIFELPVSKCSSTEFPRNNKQRTVNTSQNSFLSVSQLVEPQSFDANPLKNDTQMEPNAAKDPYSQNFSSYSNSTNTNNAQKVYKNKARSSHCKYNERKYQGYKNGSSSYTAEALIRSNTNGNYHSNEFSSDVNSNFFNGKANQKPEQYSNNNKVDFEIGMKTDFSANPNQNIYSDFNFSSPVPNFTITPSVGTDFGNHDTTGNFSSQNNSFFSDFITSEYPLPDNVSNSLLLPPCSIGLQNPFAIDKRNVPLEKNKNSSKQYSGSRNRKHYDCSKTNYNDFSIPSSSAIFTSSTLTCPPIFTTSTCQNLLSVPTQNISINFSSPSFTSSNISFPPLTSNTNANYHKFPNSSQTATSTSFFPSNSMFTTCTTKPLSTSQNCHSSNSLTSVTTSVISSFPVGNVPFSSSSQSNIPFFSLSNPIIPSSVPTSSSNSLANFNLSTIFPEINQKGNYHYS